MNKLVLSIFLLNVGFAVSAPSGMQNIIPMLQQNVEGNPQAPVVAPKPIQPQVQAAALPLMSARKAQAILVSALALMVYFGTREDNLYMNGIGFCLTLIFTVLATYNLIDR